MQINPRVSTQFTGHGSRVLHALEAQTGKSFLFEGSEGLALDHFAITFVGTREEVEERALPFRQGDEVLVDIVEPHMYDVDDAVAKIDGYIISIPARAAAWGRSGWCASTRSAAPRRAALLLDESGEVVAAPPRRPAHARVAARRRGDARRATAQSATPLAASAHAAAEPMRDARRARKGRTQELRPRSTPRPSGARRSPGRDHADEGRGRGRRGWPTIQASASWPQGRTAPFGCQRPRQPRVAARVSRAWAGALASRESRLTDMYAIVKTGGKQYRVERGQRLLVERLTVSEGEDVPCEPILYRSEEAIFDKDGLEGVNVTAKVLAHVRGEKLRVFKFKPKRGYKRRTGHRQDLARIEVTRDRAGGAAARREEGREKRPRPRPRRRAQL